MNTQNHDEKQKIDTMGGQAVIEGVLMRSPYGYAVAVRKLHNQEIAVKSVPYTPITKRLKILGLPFLRGVVSLFEMLIIGIKSLNISFKEWEDSMRIMEEQKKGESEQKEIKERKRSKGESLSIAGAMALGLILAIFMLVVLPNIMTSLVGKVLPHSTPTEVVRVDTLEGEEEYAPSEKSALIEEQQPFLYNLIAGFFRACIIVGYIYFISLMKDIRRIFEYHGAEHKTVYAFEEKGEVTVDSARQYGTAHPRCGTSFIAVVILVSIIVFALIAQLVALIWPSFTTLPFVVKKIILIGLHIVFLPLVAGTSYEVIKLASKYYAKSWIFRLFVLPGMLFQKITTKEPDDSQLEVAIASLYAALALKDTKEATSFVEGNP